MTGRDRNEEGVRAGREGRALHEVIEEQETLDDFDDFGAMSDAELDACLKTHGADPAAIRAGGKAQAEELFAARERLSWHGAMAEARRRVEALAEAVVGKARLSRAELLARLEAARTSARFAAPVAAMFHKKTAEASSDEELQALVEQLELLAQIDDQPDAKPDDEQS